MAVTFPESQKMIRGEIRTQGKRKEAAVTYQSKQRPREVSDVRLVR